MSWDTDDGESWLRCATKPDTEDLHITYACCPHESKLNATNLRVRSDATRKRSITIMGVYHERLLHVVEMMVGLMIPNGRYGVKKEDIPVEQGCSVCVCA